MIRYLRGTLAAKELDSATIDIGGIGYEVFMPLRAAAALPNLGDEVWVHIHTHVREDAFLLYGFLNPQGREIFRILLGVSGVGPKLALQILGTLSPDELIQIVHTENITRLVKVPGVGKKTAERLLLELRDRMAKLTPANPLAPATGTASDEDGHFTDLSSALLNLGYRVSQVDKVVNKLREGDHGTDFQVLLREALKRIR